MSNNEADGVDQSTPKGVTLSVANRMSLLLLAMTAMAAYSEVAVADEVSDTKAAVDSVMDGQEAPAEDICKEKNILPSPGKLQAAYLARIKSIEFPLEGDENFLRNSKLSAIRYNPRLFCPKQEGENGEQEIAGLKEETARRLRAYTSQIGDWFTLDFRKIGSDKKVKLTHENNIQLGDILVDADIQTILIQRGDGTVIKATRGVGEDGGYKGRVGFFDGNKRFVPVFSGDKFRILSDRENIETYSDWVDSEDYHRGEHKNSYQTQRGSASTFSRKEDALKAAKKLSYNPNDIKVPTQTMVEDAKKECSRDRSGNAVKNYYLALAKENMMEIVKYCAAETGVPIELILVTMKKESGFILGIVGDHGAAIGLGQLHEPVFKFVRAKAQFGEIMARFTDKPVGKIKRSESVLVDVLAIAMVLQSDIKANNLITSYKTRLSPRQIANIRFHYHVPGIFNDHGARKEKGLKRWGAGYKRYAEEVLKVREILDELAGEKVPTT